MDTQQGWLLFHVIRLFNGSLAQAEAGEENWVDLLLIQKFLHDFYFANFLLLNY